MSASDRVQLQLVIPYKQPPTHHREVRERLAAGWKIESYQRVTDREVLVTMVRDDAAAVATA